MIELQRHLRRTLDEGGRRDAMTAPMTRTAESIGGPTDPIVDVIVP
jgi:hypothetical protein